MATDTGAIAGRNQVTGDKELAQQALQGDERAKGFSEDHPVTVKRRGGGALMPLSRQNGVGTGPVADVEGKDITLELNVTAVWGTEPKLVVRIETQDPETLAWKTLGTYSSFTKPGKSTKSFSGIQRGLRAAWDITGEGPTFEFSVAEAEEGS